MADSSRLIWSDQRLYELWRAGKVKSHNMTEAERRRVNLIAIREGIAEAKRVNEERAAAAKKPKKDAA